MRVEIFYFQGCPNHRPALERVREILREEGVSAQIAEVAVPDAAAAQATGFLGSPSIRIDSLDIEPAARSANTFGLMCRTYTEDGAPSGIPSRELIRSAVREALGKPNNKPGGPRVASWLLGSSVLAAVAASLCCILPLIAAGLGLAVFSSAAIFEHWRPFLLAAAAVLFAIGATLGWRTRKRACAPGSLCATRSMTPGNLLVLLLAGGLAAAVAALPYYAGAIGAAVHAHAAGRSALAIASFTVEGMSCPSCAAGLQAGLRRMPGVTAATIDYDRRRASITYDPAMQSPAAFRDLVRQAGYQPK